MGELLRRRRGLILPSGDDTPALYGNAITATTATYYDTPILMPTGSVVTLDVHFTYGTGGVTTSGYNFFYFINSTSNGIIGRTSSDKVLRYRHSATSGYYVTTSSFGNKIVTCIELKIASKTMTVSFSDGTSVDATGSRAWLARTGTDTLRMHLTDNFYVKRLRQMDAGDVLVHDLYPAKAGSVVGMLDVVDNTFYPYNDGNAFITTI